MFPSLPFCPVCAPARRPQHPPETGVGWQPLTFTLEQEVVHAVAEGGTEVGAVLYEVAGQTLPVEVIHCVGTGGAKSR